MVKEIIWSISAQNDRKEIFTYWNNRNKSKLFSIKLHSEILDALKIIQNHSLTGNQTNIANIRILIIRDYNLFYEIRSAEIVVLRILHSKRSTEAIDYKKK